MTDQATDLQTQLAALQAQMAALAHGTPTTAPGLAGWAAPTLAPPPAAIVGVSVPVKIQTPAGSIRVYLSLPAEAGASPAALMAALEALAAAGLPLDTWQPSQSGGNDSWGGARNSGWNRDRNAGGWRR